MTYALIISLLIGKRFYLLRPQSFSFQIVSEFIDIFVKFSNFMSRDGAFDSLFCPEGMVFVHNNCPRGGGFLFLIFYNLITDRGHLPTKIKSIEFPLSSLFIWNRKVSKDSSIVQ